MSEKCWRCFRPLKTCYCKDITPVDTGVKFVFLMHPKEAYKQKTGTGRLASLSLADSEIIIGVDFTANTRLSDLLADTDTYFPVLLYPAEDAWHSDTPTFRYAIGGRKLLVIVIDATWFFARKMLFLSRNLQHLPTLSFSKPYRSEFTFKNQPAPECLSTIESVYYLTEELKAGGIARADADVTGLMEVFHRMIDFQLECEQRRKETGAALLHPELFKR